MIEDRCYSDEEWAKAVSVEWQTYDPTVTLSQLKFFRRYTHIARPPRWSIGVAELWKRKKEEKECEAKRNLKRGLE